MAYFGCINKRGAYLIEKTINQNGTYDPSDDGADGYSKVIVDVPMGTMLHKWDFTKSLNDEITGNTLDVSHATYIEGTGIKIANNNQYIELLSNESLLDCIIEIDIAEMNPKYNLAYDAYLISTDPASTGYQLAYYFTNNSHGGNNLVWKGANGDSSLTGQTRYQNTTLTYLVKSTDSSTRRMNVYANKIFEWGYNQSVADGNNQLLYFRIGHGTKAYYDITITGVRIRSYTNPI